MAVFKVPRITTLQRSALILESAELVFDIDLQKYFGGDGVTLGGISIGSSSSSDKFVETITITQTMIDNKYLTLSKRPAVPEYVIVIPTGGVQQLFGEDYLVNGLNVLWDSLGLDGHLDVGDQLIVQYALLADVDNVDVITVTESAISQKQVQLSKAPNVPANVSLVPVGGIPQLYNLDFIVTENTLQWNGLGLDNFLEPNDVLVVHY